MLSVWFLWNDITIAFDSLTRRCQSFSHFAAEVTESCKASWASSTDSCVVISAVSSAYWLQVVERSVHLWQATLFGKNHGSLCTLLLMPAISDEALVCMCELCE